MPLVLFVTTITRNVSFYFSSLLFWSVASTRRILFGKKNDTNNTLNNFFLVSAELYRSKQPSKRDVQQLEELGIKTIINLRSMHSDRCIIANTSLHSIWIRMTAGNITDVKMVAILKVIKESPKPILIHCWHGSDRTGVAIAMYRIIFQNWSKDQAIDELMQPEYGHHYNYYANIIHYIRSVDIEVIRTQIFNDN